MQMQGMNQFGNRGFGGPPQPQRQNRRGNNRGGFRNTRFDNTPQRNQNQGQGGQRPNEIKSAPIVDKPQQSVQQSQQQAKPQQQQAPKPEVQQAPQQQVQQPKQQQQAPQQAQQKPQQPQQQPQQQQKPSPVAQAKNDSQDHVDKSINVEQKNLNQHPNQNQLSNQNQNANSHNQHPNQNQQSGHNQQRNLNGNFGGNRQGGWGGQGGPGNKQGGGNFGQGNKQFGPKPGGGPGGPPRNQQRPNNMRGGLQQDGLKPVQREEQMLAHKLKDLVGPLTDLPSIDQSEVKFNGRSRLYIGNLTGDATEEEITALFAPFGETAELFINKEKNFGFIKMDYRVNAERAKRELDGKNRNGRTLRVRFAPHNSAVRVKNLPPFVSNELLYRAFEIFGKIERAYVRVDERGKTLGEGVVEFARKPSALAAIRNCTEKCFFLTSSLRPVIVESYEEPDEFDGYPEKNLPKKHPEFLRARELGPRFSELSSFEHEYGTRWKQLHELHRQKEEALKKELAAEEEKLEAQMEYAKYEHETELLREQLRQREQDRERQKRSWEMAERAADERRESERALLLRQEEELSSRMRQQDDELRRRQQENTLFVQAQRLNSMLDRQEQGMFDQQQPMDGGFRDQYDMPRGSYDDMPPNRGWEGPRQVDDYPNKRRRF
ncbi:hypothetical protein PYW08_002287 [Mythimna loreyi]|uniref:Uncharacterized protein n=1 Tax=Mythimna loreyi TaxID=667449 RepID=A0ACC2R1U9_9NEOP|nr:hypothetical protein PYW08_002287 [Mythimna loreyi]